MTRFMSSSFALFALVGLAAVAGTYAAIAADEVTELPGWNGAFPSKQYSGFLQPYEASGKRMHYWFVESEKDPSTDPILLWLNGGPGCSSLDGYLYEQGPFHLNDTGDQVTLFYNEYTWAKEVNIVFLESPAGVGFSYSSNPADYVTNDTQTANDNFNALVQFFKGFPEYKNNDFFIAGESYAGVYVPTLAARVLAGNAAGESSLNLKGIMVGNGCTGTEIGVCGGHGTGYLKDSIAGHGLISVDLSKQLDAACGDFSDPSATCQSLLKEMSDEVGNINIYSIYAPCINGNGLEVSPENQRRRVPAAHPLGGPNECIDGIAAGKWLNTPAVQKALHVSEAIKYIHHWYICSSIVNYTPTATNLPKNVYPGLIQQLEHGVLIFNGDADLCVPYLDNEAWTSGMGYPVSQKWHSWDIDSQVAGYATSYTVSGAAADVPFQFITVKGSGHMVPEFRPASALGMLRQYLSGKAF